MGFQFSKEALENSISFYREEEAFSGVNMIADKVLKDIEAVFGAKPEVTTDRLKLKKMAVIYGTIGHSPIIDELQANKKIALEEITGKNEVYLYKVLETPCENIEKALIIAGSDKRGTIYGLFHLSELLGVSPLVNWCNVKPTQKEEFIFEDNDTYTSKEPSVRFRGFFINDEWPAFGNWCTKNFGGFNAKAYEQVFELLLRLKGNYLWPAMWSARFEDDGPGLLNAQLADEYGVVMGMSHHEPCLRQGEEYKYLRGKDSIYGDAWNFRSNKEGITRFWEDGLKRSGKFENVITVGMRGEADTAIMGENATLADNIELLRDVLKTQRRLIKENVNEDLSKVPRMIALYKEVEEFFYGTEDTKGLMGCEELEDVILMLCDDNFGNLRTLPTEEMRKHKGGYGMYYHFDYHGWPISFEWINSSFLPKVWEQMTTAYEFGIQDLWIVNVGDIATQEFPLSYFLDLAYDFDKWGTKAINQTDNYTKQWIATQFAGAFDEKELGMIYEIVQGYTKIAHKRRPETMNANVYHPVNYNETKQTHQEIEQILNMAETLYTKVKKEYLAAYIALVYYPAVGNLNVYKMQLYAGLNQYFAKLGAMEANSYIEKIKECMKRDKALIDEYHKIDNGRWYGMGMSEHIGFTQWNEDECQNPILMQVMPADKERIMMMIDGTEQHAEGSPWLTNQYTIKDFLEPDVNETSITLYSITDLESIYAIENNEEYLICSKHFRTLNGTDRTKETITIKLDRSKLPKTIQDEITTGIIKINLPAGTITLSIPVPVKTIKEFPEKTFIDTKGYISMEAEHYFRKQDTDCACFEVIKDYGKTVSGLKAFPVTEYFTAGKDAPYLEYHFYLEQDGVYEAELYMQPSNAATVENKLIYGISVNDNKIEEINTIPQGEKVGDHNYVWGAGVLNNIRRQSSDIACKKGENILHIYAITPGFVLEKVVIYPKGQKPAEAFLGPAETYFVGREKK